MKIVAIYLSSAGIRRTVRRRLIGSAYRHAVTSVSRIQIADVMRGIPGRALNFKSCASGQSGILGSIERKSGVASSFFRHAFNKPSVRRNIAAVRLSRLIQYDCPWLSS
jgi:hypothetical protein